MPLFFAAQHFANGDPQFPTQEAAELLLLHGADIRSIGYSDAEVACKFFKCLQFHETEREFEPNYGGDILFIGHLPIKEDEMPLIGLDENEKRKLNENENDFISRVMKRWCDEKKTVPSYKDPKVKFSLLPCRGMANMDFLEATVLAALSQDDPTVFVKNSIPAAVVQYIWEDRCAPLPTLFYYCHAFMKYETIKPHRSNLRRPVHLVHFSLHCFNLGLLSLLVYQWLLPAIVLKRSLQMLFIITLFGLVGKIMYIWSGHNRKQYLTFVSHSSFYYALDVLRVVLFVWYWIWEDDVSLSCLSLVMWFKFLYFLRPFDATGHVIKMIIDILKKTVAYITVVSIVLIGFSQAFYVLSKTSSCPVNGNTSCKNDAMEPGGSDFSSPVGAFLTAFAYMEG